MVKTQLNFPHTYNNIAGRNFLYSFQIYAEIYNGDDVRDENYLIEFVYV